MIDGVIDKVDAFAARYRRLILIVVGAWMILNWAASAHMIELPEIPMLTGITGIIASTVVMGLWWAWLNPRIEKRRTQRELEAAPRDAIDG